MRKHVFFKREEIKKAKEERRNPISVFSIECSIMDLAKYVRVYDLEPDWIWS